MTGAERTRLKLLIDHLARQRLGGQRVGSHQRPFCAGCGTPFDKPRPRSCEHCRRRQRRRARVSAAT